jgi:hypothetical protein
MDDYLQQDSIACRIRAKRGCATHPRSIAERVSSPPTSFVKALVRRTCMRHLAATTDADQNYFCCLGKKNKDKQEAEEAARSCA